MNFPSWWLNIMTVQFSNTSPTSNGFQNIVISGRPKIKSPRGFQQPFQRNHRIHRKTTFHKAHPFSFVIARIAGLHCSCWTNSWIRRLDRNDLSPQDFCLLEICSWPKKRNNIYWHNQIMSTMLGKLLSSSSRIIDLSTCKKTLNKKQLIFVVWTRQQKIYPYKVIS